LAMLSKQAEVTRVGVWAVVAAAMSGLLVLFLAGAAYSQEASRPEDVAQWLVPDARPSAAERVEEAQALLREVRRRRVMALHITLVDTAWQVVSQASPKRLLKNALRVIQQLREWKKRSPAEDRALDLLEAEIRAGAEDERLRELYEQLRQREDQERLDRLLAEAERAIASGDLRLARRRLERARAINPDAAGLQAASRALEGYQREPAPPTHPPVDEIEAWEATLGAALLLERYAFALEFRATRPDAELAQAVAQYLSGEKDEAFATVQRLREMPGPTGELAGRWLEGKESVSKSAALAQPVKRLIKTVVDRGPERRRGLAYAMSLPDRIKTGSRTARKELRQVALRSLRRSSPSESEEPPRGWDDGNLLLPLARTRYAPVSPRPVLVSRAALEVALGTGGEELVAELGQADAIWLAPKTTGEGLTAQRALPLIGALATGIEDGSLRPLSRGMGVALERIRCIHTALREGATLSIEPWSVASDSVGKVLKRSLLKGDRAELRSVSLQRRKESLNVAKTWLGREFKCPGRAVCVDRMSKVRSQVYGRLDLSADVRVGARTSFGGAKLALEVNRSGPHGSLVLPVAAWLGLSRWIPVEAFIEFGLGGISIGPRFARPKASPHTSSLVPSLRQVSSRSGHSPG